MEPFSAEELAGRRAALGRAAQEDVIVVVGSEPTGHLLFPFRQNDDFYYLTGWNEPGGVLVLVRAERGSYEEYLFLPERNRKRETWDGARTAPGDERVAMVTGLREVSPHGRLKSFLMARRKARLSVGWAGAEKAPAWVADWLEPRKLEPVAEKIERLRHIKSDAELTRVRAAVAASVRAHRAAWRALGPGRTEREIAGIMLAEMMGAGCWRPAYAPIVGAGANATTLHYSALQSEMGPNDVVLMDVGGEFGHYAADITRTVPVSGRYSNRQRAIYDIVLAAHDAAVAAARPGVRLGGSGTTSLHSIARKVLDDLGRQRLGRPLGEDMIHGVGHHVGLAVHDPIAADTKLQAGAVVTIEPGVYLPDEGLGVRIESMLLITSDGAEVLTSALPTDADEIESIFAGTDAADDADSLESRVSTPSVRNRP